jgi:hypothetical protein
LIQLSRSHLREVDGVIYALPATEAAVVPVETVLPLEAEEAA